MVAARLAAVVAAAAPVALVGWGEAVRAVAAKVGATAVVARAQGAAAGEGMVG